MGRERGWRKEREWQWTKCPNVSGGCPQGTMCHPRFLVYWVYDKRANQLKKAPGELYEKTCFFCFRTDNFLLYANSHEHSPLLYRFEPLSFGREARIALSVMRMYWCCVVDAQIKFCDLTQMTQISVFLTLWLQSIKVSQKQVSQSGLVSQWHQWGQLSRGLLIGSTGLTRLESSLKLL